MGREFYSDKYAVFHEQTEVSEREVIVDVKGIVFLSAR